MKTAGAVFVKSKKYEDAIKVYENAFQVLKPSPEDQKDPSFIESLKLQNVLFNNLSLCYHNLGQHRQAILYASRVLYVDPNNIKALFRIAQGQKALGEKAMAFETIQKCVSAYKSQHPGQNIDNEILKLYHVLKEENKGKIDEEKKNSQQMFSKMFNGKNQADSPKKGAKQKLSKPIMYGLCTLPSVLMGFAVHDYIKHKTKDNFGSGLLGVISSAGIFSGLIGSDNKVSRSILSVMPFAVLLLTYLLKNKE